MTDNEQTLKEIAEYFSTCYMNAAHGQAQVKFQRYIDTVHDALRLLKDQEPIEPKLVEESNGLIRWHCKACNSVIGYGVCYCSQCGRAVKWDD